VNAGPVLDVAIPAFRARHLDACLESLCAQDDRNFRVLVGDDASPDDLEALCERYRGRLDLAYHRFPTNLGGRNLTQQWDRTVRLGGNPWVWLFSDDDVASSGCVGALRAALAEGAPLVRLDLRLVGSAGEVLDVPPPAPDHESAEAFLWERLKRRRESFAVEFAFARDRWEASGGFVDLPSAWCSDDATWFALAGEAGIRRARGGRVDWRWSGANITASHRWDAAKREAVVRFLERVGAHGLSAVDERLGLARGSAAAAAADWFWFHQEGLRAAIGWGEAKAIETRLQRVLGTRARGAGRRLWKRNLRWLLGRARNVPTMFGAARS